jgi:hypothetical protein
MYYRTKTSAEARHNIEGKIAGRVEVRVHFSSRLLDKPTTTLNTLSLKSFF